MFLRLCGPPSIPLSFIVADVHQNREASEHRLRRGLPGYLILFDTHAFALQRQARAGKPLSLPGFQGISMHFTATYPVPPPSTGL